MRIIAIIGIKLTVRALLTITGPGPSFCEWKQLCHQVIVLLSLTHLSVNPFIIKGNKLAIPVPNATFFVFWGLNRYPNYCNTLHRPSGISVSLLMMAKPMPYHLCEIRPKCIHAMLNLFKITTRSSTYIQ